MTATRRSLLEEVVRAGATYPDVGEPPSVHQMSQTRMEREPHLRAWQEKRREAEAREAKAIAARNARA